MVDFAIFSFHVTETFHVANNRHLLSRSPDHSQTCRGRGNFCFLLLTYHQVTDLHRHYVDDITIPSKRGPEFGVLKRVDDVSFFGP